MKNNIYGTRQAAENWFDMLKTGLGDEGFKQNTVYTCLFVINNCILIIYVDDCCIIPKDKNPIDSLLKNPSNTFNMTNERVVKYYIGKNVIKYPNGTIIMSQTAIINKILNSLGIFYESKMHDTRANVILTKYEYGNGSKK